MIRNMLRSLGLRGQRAEPLPDPRPVPEYPPLSVAQDLAILGDVHGTIRLLTQALARLDREAPQARVICVGDLIDRGDDSADVLRLAFDRRDSLIVLLGNHEEMMLRFLDDPPREAGRWLRNGGLQTLASLSIAPPGATASPAQYTAVRDKLREALGPDIEDWLRGLPRSFQSGNLLVTHAGADPWHPVSQQDPQVLTWGHPDFGRRRRTDGLWIAHGHVIVTEPRVAEGVISVDTGAYAGGGLTAALVTGSDVRFTTEFP